MTADRPMGPPILAITMGDPAGIGPEIIARAWPEATRLARCLVVGDPAHLRRAAAVVGTRIDVVDWSAQPGAAQWLPRLAADDTGAILTMPVLAAAHVAPDLRFGVVDAGAGQAAYDCVIAAIDLALAGRIGGIVTAPLHKEALAAAGIRHPGHTEILAERAGAGEVAMMLVNRELRTVLVSIHVSLREAITRVTPDNERRAIRLAARACHAFGIERPRIAVAGLNPHAGEGGLFGDEDAAVIAPAIAAARAEGIDASGPWPGDTVFMRARRGEFDIVVAQYHDQGLIPVKYLGIEQGVNVTLGLPFVRTSVDHGTAFDIAGQGSADHRSLLEAIEVAARLLTRGGTWRGEPAAAPAQG